MNNSFLHIYKTLCFSFSLSLSCFISWFYSRIFREVLLNSWFVNMPFLSSFLRKVNYRSNVYILLTPATTLSTSAIILPLFWKCNLNRYKTLRTLSVHFMYVYLPSRVLRAAIIFKHFERWSYQNQILFKIPFEKYLPTKCKQID